MVLGVSTKTNDELDIDEKFAKALLILRTLRPFYSAIYEVMEKQESELVTTMGVTTDKLVYNKEFIQSIPFSEFMFVILHEIAHIALKHVARREKRDPVLWNIACDFYVNAMLSYEFGFSPSTTDSNSRGKTLYNNTSAIIEKLPISFPKWVLYDSTVDIYEDNAEELYQHLEKQGNENGYFNEKINSPSNEMGNKSYKFSLVTKQKENRSTKTKDKGANSEVKQNTGCTHGENEGEFKVTTTTVTDLIDDGSDQNSKEQSANKIVTDAQVRVEMSSKTAGTDPGELLRLAKLLSKTQIDWRKLLKRYLVQATISDSSFASPDKRMYYQKAIYPGQTQDILNNIKGVKVCIDTSGSISDEDLSYFFAQVYDLTQKFKIDAELIYWDAEIQSKRDFKIYKEFERVDCTGGGGTDASVVFNYFESKACKVKPVVTLIFTDGYFPINFNTPKFKRKYKNTIWIMTKAHNTDFNPPFGIVTKAKFK